MEKISRGEIDGVIFRPSIIIGDSMYGRLINYNGYYLAIEVINNLMNKTGGIHCIRMNVNSDSTINLIHIDHAIEIMIQISNCQVKPSEVFNIVNNEAINTRQAIKSIAALFKIKIDFVERENIFSKTHHEKIIEYGLNYVIPYLNRNIHFNTTNTDSLLGFPYKYKITDKKLQEINLQFLEYLKSTKRLYNESCNT